jgi:ferric-dicitrate binding protein FerR (iron transport regulator)
MMGGEAGKRGEDRYARLAARLLTEQRAVCAPDPVDVRRDAVVAAMALAIAAKAGRRRIAAVSAVALAVAASVLVAVRLAGSGGLTGAKPDIGSALVVEHTTGRGNQLVRAGAAQPLPDFGVLAVGDGVRSGEEGSAVLGLSNGTRVALSSSSNLRVDDLGSTRRFSLFGGQLQAHVAKLRPGERFIVSTPDSEVEVRGTVFTVAVNGPSPACRDSVGGSTVHVSEGAVWVRSGNQQVVLHPGESWSTPCLEPQAVHAVETAERAPPAAGSTALSVRAGRQKAAGPRVTSTAAPAPSQKEWPVAAALAPPRTDTSVSPASRLADQNDLFSAAMSAERQGQHDLALRKLDELVTRFPSGPLSESAHVERQRILSAKSPR